jgi:hypothetical protein
MGDIMIASWAMSLAGLLALATPAYAGEIADCAHDRFLEANASPKINTVVRMDEASALAVKICLGEHPSPADHAEFEAGADRAVSELLQALKGQKL